jgi:serine/threonine protein kinase
MAVSVERQLRETSCRDIVTFVGALATRWARAGSAGSAGGARQRTFPSRIRVIQVASIFFHRGCTRLCLAEDSPIVVAVTCVFLAAKVEEAKHIRLRDVLSTCRDIAQLTDGAPRSAGLKDRMRGIRIGVDDILVMERRLLHAIAFEIFIKTPTQALAKIKGVRKSDRVMVARFIADSLRTSLCLQFPPGVMARAAVFLHLLNAAVQRPPEQQSGAAAAAAASPPLSVDGMPADADVVSWCQQMLEFYESLGLNKFGAKSVREAYFQRKRNEGPGAAKSYLCAMLNVDINPPPLPSLPSPPSSSSANALAPLRDRSSYRSLKELGKGTYGVVTQAKCVDEDEKIIRKGTMVALKKISFDVDKGWRCGLPTSAFREIKILKGIHHPNMVRCFEIIDGIQADEEEAEATSAAAGKKTKTRVAYAWPRPFFMVFECLQYDLDGILYCNREHFTPAHVQCYMKQILEGLAVIHGQGVIHRDLKPSNILMNSKGVIKIADWGLAVFGAETMKNRVTKEAELQQSNSSSNSTSSSRSTNVSPTSAAAIVAASSAHSNSSAPPSHPTKLRTTRVVTLWYRAIELLLSDYKSDVVVRKDAMDRPKYEASESSKTRSASNRPGADPMPDYGQAIDVWSAGCIFMEMLKVAYKVPVRQYGPPVLFPGSGEISQVRKIFHVCGKPTEEMSTHGRTWKGWSELKYSKAWERVDIGSTGGRGLYGMFPKDHRPPKSALNVDNTRTADEQGLLQKMLRLDPKRRVSTMAAVQHDYFSGRESPRCECCQGEHSLLGRFNRGADPFPLPSAFEQDAEQAKKALLFGQHDSSSSNSSTSSTRKRPRSNSRAMSEPAGGSGTSGASAPAAKRFAATEPPGRVGGGAAVAFQTAISSSVPAQMAVAAAVRGRGRGRGLSRGRGLRRGRGRGRGLSRGRGLRRGRGRA